MIYAVTVTNHVGESLRCELANPELSGFAITRIEGIGPGSASINVTDVSTMDGGFHNSSRIPARNITMSVVFFDSPIPGTNRTSIYGVETTRHNSYRYFPLKKQIKLAFETDERKCEIYGIVESNEPDIFSSQESAEISIICPDPYFRLTSESGYASAILSSAGLFQFPFSNEGLGEVYKAIKIGTTQPRTYYYKPENLIQFGEISDNFRAIVPYDGDVETGIVIRIHATSSTDMIQIYYVGTSGSPTNYTDPSMYYDPEKAITISGSKIAALTGRGISNQDDIVISTVKGQKYAQLIRGGTVTNILGCFEGSPYWFQLERGYNVFVTTINQNSADIFVGIDYPILYLGV